MHLQEITLISNLNQEINIPGFNEPINIHDIRSIVIENLIIREILLHSGRLYTGLNYLPKSK